MTTRPSVKKGSAHRPRLKPRSFPDAGAADAEARQLMADLVGFHRREAKPAWWAFFDRQEQSAEELAGRRRMSWRVRCRWQGLDGTGQKKPHVPLSLSRARNEASRGRLLFSLPQRESQPVPSLLLMRRRASSLSSAAQRKASCRQELSLMPGGPVNTDALRDSVWAVARDMVSGGHAFPHIGALLRREAPRLLGRPIGAPIIEPVDREDPDRLLEASKRAVHALDRSWLVIQGPPGAGKTYTTSHLAVWLIQAGKTVGIASNSHKAIDNVLRAIEERLVECGEPVRLLGQKKDSGDEGFAGRGFIESVTNNGDVDPSIPIIAGTAWAFANPDLATSRDVLFVDEAGTGFAWKLGRDGGGRQVDRPRGRSDATWLNRSRASIPATAAAPRSIICLKATPSYRQSAVSSYPRLGACTRTYVRSSLLPYTRANCIQRRAAQRNGWCSQRMRIRH